MFSFKEINYTTDAFHVVITPEQNNFNINAVRVIITDNYTHEILENMVLYDLKTAIKFIEDYEGR